MDVNTETHLSAEEAQSEFRNRCLREAGLSYSVGAILVIVLSLITSVIMQIAGSSTSETDWVLFLSYLLSQVAFLGAAVIYFVRSREPVKTLLVGSKWKYFLIAILLQFGLLFSLSFLNDFFVSFFERFGYRSSDPPLPSLEGWKLLPAILVIAVIPAIFEEVLFRGILSRNMHASGWGLISTCVIAGALFSLYHGNPEQTVYQFICGICFTLTAIRAGSILPTMLAHFLNNALILILTAFGLSNLAAMPFGGYLALMLTSGVCLVGTLVYLIFFDKSGNQKGRVQSKFFVLAAIGIAVCAVEWIYALVSGFYG